MSPKAGFSISALALSVLTAALANTDRTVGTARETVLSGLLQSMVLMVLIWLTAGIWNAGNARHRTAALAMSLAFLAELAQTVVQAQRVAQQEFHSMALVGILPLLLWAGWTLTPNNWNAPARTLWWFIFLGGIVCLAGLVGQMRWFRLLAESAPQQPEKPAAGGRVRLQRLFLPGPRPCLRGPRGRDPGHPQGLPHQRVRRAAVSGQAF